MTTVLLAGITPVFRILMETLPYVDILLILNNTIRQI